MRAAVMTNWQLNVEDIEEPTPGPGQALVDVLACGICGSDLHMLSHGEEQRRISADWTEDEPADPLRPQLFEPACGTVMGHEFCCRVVEIGPECTQLRSGDIVVSLPAAFDATGVHPIGYSNRYPGGYCERMVVNDALALKVPNGLEPRLAALTEPFAVGVHAVAKSRIAPEQAALVLGCGPVGLAVIAELRRRGLGPIVAADFSATRRNLAEAAGADVVVDPRVERAIDAWRRTDGARPLVIFEAVGVPGMLTDAMRMAPRATQIVVVGACMQPDVIHPMLGVTKELEFQFVFGYDPLEFAGALHSLAEGEVDLQGWITGTVGIDDVPRAFADLGDPDQHAKIVVVPAS